mmetsp:Transcript_15881/g.29014  ORF Transcript_15881/g.29014 Transcript_15881/m.29014 type:complete len:132 (-) Transcript_15881:23-418(-)
MVSWSLTVLGWLCFLSLSRVTRATKVHQEVENIHHMRKEVAMEVTPSASFSEMAEKDEPEEQGPYFEFTLACNACAEQFCSESSFKGVGGTCVYKKCASQNFPGSVLWCWQCAPDGKAGESTRCDQEGQER